MLASCLLRLMRLRLVPLLATLACWPRSPAVLWLAAPVLKAIGNWNLAFFFVLLLAAGVLLGVPIGFAFGTATIAFLA